MIRNVCIHVQNEQPLLADLFDVPTAADAGLLCTNVRMLDGKRPVFIDSIEATFFFPYHVVRFVEIPEGAIKRRTATPVRTDAPELRHPEPDSEPGTLPDEQRLPVPVAAALGHDPDDDPDEDAELEIDEGFLQRIRDI